MSFVSHTRSGAGAEWNPSADNAVSGTPTGRTARISRDTRYELAPVGLERALLAAGHDAQALADGQKFLGRALRNGRLPAPNMLGADVLAKSIISEGALAAMQRIVGPDAKVEQVDVERLGYQPKEPVAVFEISSGDNRVVVGVGDDEFYPRIV